MSDEFPKVMPHGPVQEAFAHVHYVLGSVQMAPLVRLARTMTILEHEGELTLINAIRLSEAGEAALEALGKVAHVMKIGLHGMDDPYTLDRFGAEYWAYEGADLPSGIETARTIAPGVELPIPGMEVFAFERTKWPETALLVPWNGGLLLTCDCVQNWESTAGCSLVGKLVTRAMGFVKPAQIGPPWRKAQTKEGDTLRPDFERLAALPFKNLIGGHGVPLLGDAEVRFAETITRVYG